MAIPANLELAAYGERRRSSPARFYLEHERLAISGGTLVAVLLVWEALGRSGLVDPLFISFPTQVAQAGWQLSHDRDFWNDVEVSATSSWATARRWRWRSRSGLRSVCPSACNT